MAPDGQAVEEGTANWDGVAFLNLAFAHDVSSVFDRLEKFLRAIAAASPSYSVRPNGAVNQWRKVPPRKLSVGPGS
jgi:hypothetical protein